MCDGSPNKMTSSFEAALRRSPPADGEPVRDGDERDLADQQPQEMQQLSGLLSFSTTGTGEDDKVDASTPITSSNVITTGGLLLAGALGVAGLSAASLVQWHGFCSQS